MSVLLLTIFILSSNGYSSVLSQHKSDVGLNTAQMIENHRYLCENNDITTEDGYILTYQRIPHGISNRGTHKTPVLIMHGLLSTSAYFVSMGPRNGLGYILADLGYDVWLANVRGNAWSRKHKSLDVILDNEEFYDFSWHEVGPAAIDYILNVTYHDKMQFIGHSQGGTAFLVLTSTRPEYNERIKLATLLAPAAFMEHTDNRIFKAFSEYIYEIEVLLHFFRIYEVPFIDEAHIFFQAFCANPEGRAICSMLGSLFGTETPKEMEERIPVFLSNAPSNCAIRMLLHYGQLIRNGGFRQYDHGIVKNLQKYGQQTPPNYDLSKISAPVAIFHSPGDLYVSVQDMKETIQRLPNVVYVYQGPHKLGHAEMVFLREMIDPVSGELIKVMRKYG